MLLGAGADKDKCAYADGCASSGTPLYMAAYYGRVAVVRLLLGAGADIDAGFLCSPLHAAVYRRDPDLARLLLQAGADINQVASHDGHWALVQHLLKVIKD